MVSPTPAGVFNVVVDAEQTHYVTIIMRLDVAADAAPQNREPHKCDGWTWVDYPDGIPHPRFPSLQALMDSPFQL